MANLLRLIALVLLFAGAVPDAAAVVRSEAFAKCHADGNTVKGNVPEVNSWTCTDVPHATDPNQGYFNCTYKFTFSNGSTVGPYSCSAYAPAASGAYHYDSVDPTCESRNDNPETAPGPRLSLAQNTGPKCVGGCVLDITGDPLETVQGRVQGQPVVYYRFAQEYTGEECTTDPDEGDNADDLDPVDTPDGEKQCNASLGVCVDENGNNEYCTFNPDGTPSSCVPAIDYDNDGVPDDNDTQPADDTNGADDGTGDETDNMASGGAACPHKGGQPPACRGDAIQCNLLLQQYLSRCNAEKVLDGTVTGGIVCSNAAPLVCTNMSPGECFEKAMQKKAACAAEGIEQHLAGGDLDEGPEIDPMSIWQDGDGTGEGDFDLDMTGWLTNRACPVLPSMDVLGTTISLQSVQAPMCSFFSVGRMLILLIAAFQAARILGET